VEEPYKLFESFGARLLVDGDTDWCVPAVLPLPQCRLHAARV
jgi:hypothetical protein